MVVVQEIIHSRPAKEVRVKMQDSAEQAASRVLETALGSLTFLDLPIDPIDIASRLGLQVYTTELRSDVSGALTRTPGSAPTIFLNRDDSPNRQRFSCAHEIGHFVQRKDAGTAETFEYIDMRGPLATTGRDPEERYANQFAAALLMPAELVEQLVDVYDPSTLASTFGVSGEAMGYRLVNLGLR